MIFYYYKPILLGQVLVYEGDQPLYAIAKEIQIVVPGYGFTKLFPMMGALHIEFVLDSIFAELIRGSGLTDVVNIADLSIESAGNVLSNASGNTRVRYLMQVSCVCNILYLFDYLLLLTIIKLLISF